MRKLISKHLAIEVANIDAVQLCGGLVTVINGIPIATEISGGDACEDKEMEMIPNSDIAAFGYIEANGDIVIKKESARLQTWKGSLDVVVWYNEKLILGNLEQAVNAAIPRKIIGAADWLPYVGFNVVKYTTDDKEIIRRYKYSEKVTTLDYRVFAISVSFTAKVSNLSPCITITKSDKKC